MKQKTVTYFSQVIEENQGIIHKICRMYLKLEEERKDLFQEILLQLWRSFDSFEGQSKISTWIYRVALNTAITYFRKTKKRPQKVDIPLSDLKLGYEDGSIEEQEDIKMLYQAIDKLSKIERAIILLYLEEKSNKDIAEIMGITQNNVNVKINRIKKKLKKILVAQ